MRTLEYGQTSNGSSAVVLGRFESLHIGHRALLERARSLIIHGEQVVLMMIKDADNVRNRGVILNLEERISRAQQLGADAVWLIDFDDNFKNTSAEDFFFRLRDTLSPSALVCGNDFRFGRGRAGDVELLGKLCKDNGIRLVTDTVSLGGVKVSSTEIKARLGACDAEGANAMLGYNYFITGKVIEGRKVGRQMGFPTANLAWPPQRAKVGEGVYATRVTYCGREYIGITNVGPAPTFGFDKSLAETHILNFDADLYGEEIKVEFLSFLRQLKKFNSAAELTAQLKRDMAATSRRYL